jgi:pyridoxal phosphate enzyme (YggS family)
MATIADNLQAVKGRIEQAARLARREPTSVTLLAVSKTHPVACIEEARTAGQNAFGENYVQEAVEKMDAIDAGSQRLPALEWHLIGALQSNKTRMVAERFAWVHTVSSEKIARRLSEQRPAAMAPLNALIQVNVSGETTKSGVSLQEALPLAQKISSFKGIRLRGLMAVPEPTDDTGLQRSRFCQVREVLEELKRRGFALDTLSMGMSDDMESAIAEGSTLVRIGTAIFGKRNVGARTIEKSAA